MSNTGGESGTSARLVIRALALFVVIDAGFKLFGFGRVARALARRATHVGRSRIVPVRRWSEIGRRTFHAVTVATRYYYRGRLDCLPKALTTHYLLRTQGVASEFCLGVRRFPFAGHAWVEVEGERLDDSPSARYRAGTYTILERF